MAAPASFELDHAMIDQKEPFFAGEKSLFGWESTMEEPPDEISQAISSPAFVYMVLLERWPTSSSAAAWCQSRIIDHISQLQQEPGDTAKNTVAQLFVLMTALPASALTSLLTALRWKALSFIGVGNALAKDQHRTLVTDSMLKPAQRANTLAVLWFLISMLPDESTSADGDSDTKVVGTTGTPPKSSASESAKSEKPTAAYLTALLAICEKVQPSTAVEVVRGRAKVEASLGKRLHEMQLADLKCLPLLTVKRLLLDSYSAPPPFIPSTANLDVILLEDKDKPGLSLILLIDQYLLWASSALPELSTEIFCGMASHPLASVRANQTTLLGAISLFLKSHKIDSPSSTEGSALSALLDCSKMTLFELEQALATPQLEPMHKTCLVEYKRLADAQLTAKETAIAKLKQENDMVTDAFKTTQKELQERIRAHKAEVEALEAETAHDKMWRLQAQKKPRY